MTRTISLFTLSLCLLFLLTVFATANDKSSPYEEIYPEIGYKTVEEALNDFEQHFKQRPKLPLRVPPISFTHHFGRFNNLEGDINDSFEVAFLNDQLSENHYKIIIRPLKHKLVYYDEKIEQTLILSSGKEAIFSSTLGFNVLVFEIDKWQYSLYIDKKVSDKVTTETLVEIANSIEYPTEPQ